MFKGVSSFARQCGPICLLFKLKKLSGFDPLFVPFFKCPQRRAQERSKKGKKVGVRYYETHNVKNKNKNRRAPAPTAESHGAKRQKH